MKKNKDNRSGFKISDQVEGQSAGIHLTATTGHGAIKMIYCALDPNMSFPTFDLLLTPIMISSISLSFIN